MSFTPRPEVYDTYWYFAAERQNTFIKRLSGAKAPYTQDPILAQYKFCNTYRALDRETQFLIREVIYSSSYSPQDTLFRIMLFRLFNKHQTWVALEKLLGEISLTTFSPGAYSALLEKIREEGPIYGNAFILCANKAFGFDQKHNNHLALLEYTFLRSEMGRKLEEAKSLRELFMVLRELPLIGNFMAYQIAIDMNYSEVFNFSENDFTIAGPGAERGIAKCFSSYEKSDREAIIMYMVENQEKEFQRLGLNFARIGNRPLQAIDCQGLFCETDKYSRVRFPELASNRKQIKASFTPSPAPIEYFFPPKWQIEAICTGQQLL